MKDYTEYRGSIEENEKKLWNKCETSDLNFEYEELDAYKRAILKNLILKHVKIKHNLKILDVSTGNGLFAMVMAEEGYDITATDSNIQTINYARKNANNQKLKIKFKVMDKYALDFRDNTFDLVISSNITWDIRSPKSAFREWRRVLKDDGTLIYFDSNWNKNISLESRPYLDIEILKGCGFSEVNVYKDVYEQVFSAKGVLPYKNYSTFMVVANR
ncbi:MAG: class I SAM-dependent methyltransferase [Peptostreptococcaceae bacterium]